MLRAPCHGREVGALPALHQRARVGRAQGQSPRGQSVPLAARTQQQLSGCGSWWRRRRSFFLLFESRQQQRQRLAPAADGRFGDSLGHGRFDGVEGPRAWSAFDAPHRLKHRPGQSGHWKRAGRPPTSTSTSRRTTHVGGRRQRPSFCFGFLKPSRATEPAVFLGRLKRVRKLRGQQRGLVPVVGLAQRQLVPRARRLRDGEAHARAAAAGTAATAAARRFRGQSPAHRRHC
mmetsp:Transcript_58055/g.116665  ORF Transcript_58055/g.116665 Transcript_58055/m.116665 type:complete len:232 (-) Transcript_58055:123-818(-)